MKNNPKKPGQFKRSLIQTHLSRVWFMAQGCKQCPIEITIRPLWAKGDEGYFLSARGTKLKLNHSLCKRTKGRQCHNGKRGQNHPILQSFKGQLAHRLMAYTYAEEPCPIFLDSKGKPYKGIVHHVIENPYDIRVDHLLWWLTYKQHHIADKRRRALEEILPDMYVVPTAFLKTLQDPRATSEDAFQSELEKLRQQYGKA